ncbi:MAG TPA: hypothetical protein VLE50_05595 [Cellvibrio sp.]|nr:hypothetical protein [Cellvibrio sp.]
MRKLNITGKVLAVIYAIVMGANFYRWDACFWSERTEYSPDVNIFLTSVGIIAQILHVALVLYFGFFPEKFPREGRRIAKIVLVILSTYLFTGAVQHGVLEGDEARAYFHRSGCWSGF